ncbi:DUF1329 domain-containing protein [Metapseudomonas boanensis]|uniref:DUF1329 domain-containing protein n=1 Tax=Metapseudomonas boanensis TaxID=2822138 RepID=A0ABS5XK99_9GAMM|nr:DUF1329 domain-containing protein [Pseudomonas boanensis]MBT8766727.1 DUF1329 domain-containing protein [Pseudomonas boanensis]
MKVRDWKLKVTTLGLAAAVTVGTVHAVAEELTPFGAIKGANADGSIPAYTGGITTPPAGYAGDGNYIDPYGSEKPLYSITNQNLADYKDQLTQGTRSLFERFPDYRVDVYPTHRSMHWPDFVLKNTAEHVGQAKLGGTVEGDRLENAFAGIPFPAPKTGYEALWNRYFTYIPYLELSAGSYMVDSRGAVSLLPQGTMHKANVIYEPKLQNADNVGLTDMANIVTSAPANVAGYAQLRKERLDYGSGGTLAWFYDPGQRRVRVAPNYTYDIPSTTFGGATFYDEVFLFSGRMDRFNYKLVGRQEIILPYNSYKILQSNYKDVLGQKFLNPDFVRWEKHRVWVVEAELKPDTRHAYKTRRYFLDEDSWVVLATEGYDHSGALHRVGFTYPIFEYTGLGGVSNGSYGFYDFNRGSYAFTWMGKSSGKPAEVKFYKEVRRPEMFTPRGIASTATR